VNLPISFQFSLSRSQNSSSFPS